jgi:Tfp pilus assembly protein PilO
MLRKVARWRSALPPHQLWSRLRWTSRRWLRTLGKPGVLAIGILVVFPPFYFSAIAPAQERLDAARRGTLSLREQILHASQSLGGMRRTPAEQLAEFYRIFPQERNAPQWLKKLFALAEKNGLSLQEGEYKANRDKVGRLMRFQMVLPVKGEYPQIRRFLAALPAEIPVIALENVQFSRQNVADPVVEARIRLTLYLEQAS